MNRSLPLATSVTAPAGGHGGPDALGVPQHDFSTNSNACGPCPHAVAALQACDPGHYPDPTYTALRAQLADFHGVAASRLLLAGSASEFIFRVTAWTAQQGGQAVQVPAHAYGDYAQAARAWGLPVVTAGPAGLQWLADPSSPLGQTLDADSLQPPAPVRVLDCAYAPLRLSGHPALDATARDAVWQMWTPNKALGLTGVRAAYVIAPLGAQAAVAGLNRLCASWPLGAHGVALLQAWVQPAVQDWLAQSLCTLRTWKTRQVDLLDSLGWACLPSESNFFCARPALAHGGNDLGALLTHLRGQGIKLRDATSFGLPGLVRVSVQPPASQDVLAAAVAQYSLHSHPLD